MSDKVKWRDAKALRDRIKVLEAEVLEQARLLGKSGERELALRAENASLKIGLDATSANLIAAQEEVGRLLTVVKFVAEMDDLYPESNGDAWKAKDMARAALKGAEDG